MPTARQPTHFNSVSAILFTVKDRMFQLWDCRVGHSRLLIRSYRPTPEDENIDLRFWGVNFLSMPTILGPSLDVAEGSTEELTRMSGRERHRDLKLYVLRDPNGE